MKSWLVALTVVPLVALAVHAKAQTPVLKPVPPAARARIEAYAAKISPSARLFVASEARRILVRGSASPTAIRADIPGDLRLQGADAGAIVELVLLQAADDQEQDLRQQIAQMQDDATRKKALREQNARMLAAQAEATAQAAREFNQARTMGKIAPSVTFAQFQAQRKAAGSASDIGEPSPLKLQTMTDQRSKILETLSNLMKAESDARASITDNMK